VPATAKVLLFVGRINPKKRLEDIIAAFAELAPREPDLHLILAGQADAAYSRVLRAMVDRTGLSARVRWVGFLDETAKPAAYAAADCFVHASVSEGMALAILEAMAQGLPVVATEGCYMRAAAERGALRECAQGGAALAAALAPVLADPAGARALGAAGRRHIREEHDWDRLARRYLRIYEEGLRAR
jgi:glycosyltransferase involved in cell wall biosynthesis